MDKKKEIEEMAEVISQVQYLGGLEDKVAEKLVKAGYGNVKLAIKEFAENVVNPIIDEIVTLMFDDNKSTCIVDDCEKEYDISCGSSICVRENQQIWKDKILQQIK